MKQEMIKSMTFTAFLSLALIFMACNQSRRMMSVSTNEAKDIVANWPAKPKEAVDMLMSKYGTPDEITSTMVIWYDKGPWKKTMVMKNEIPHDFPKSHTDFLQQTIEYKVPLGKYDDLARYDGSVIVERTKGTISARCDKEELNFLALNLANDVATGKKTVEQARSHYAMIATKFMNGGTDPYLQGLQFKAMPGSGDPDRPAQ
jgi:hypothetical protein